jgi:ERCC4-related helicase
MRLAPERLRPAAYQLIPLAKLLANRLNCLLIADGVGVGKTISAGYVLTYARSKYKKPAFVVCSPTLIPKWVLELKSKFNITALPVRSVEDLETASIESEYRPLESQQPVYVMSNNVLFSASQKDYPFTSAAVFDEIHTYRNPTTKLQRQCLELARKSHIRVGLTATPINNRLEDLVSELAILLTEYELEVVDATVKDLWHSERRLLTGALVTRFLKEKLGIHFANRNVEDILIAYPESYVREAARAIKERATGRTFLEQITYYRLAASSPWAFWSALGLRELRERWEDPKLDALNRVITEKPDVTHWIVFCEFKETVEFLSRKLTHPNVFTMTGDTPMFDRESIVNSFRGSPGGLLIVTSVGSEGLDLQFCGGLVNYDLHWNPMKLEQRAGRLDRVGQDRKTIRLVNIHVANSVDDRVLSVLRRKLELISSSVFAPGPLLPESGKTTSGIELYDEQTLANELDAGSSLVETFRLNATIDTHDYTALPSVDTSLCEPEHLESSVQRLTADSIVRDGSWIRSVSDSSSSVARLLRDYS